MSFEERIPEHIETLDKLIVRRIAERGLIDWGSDGHECDCEYCDRAGEDATEGDPQAQEKADAIDKEIDELRHTITSLKAHAAVHKVKLELV